MEAGASATRNTPPCGCTELLRSKGAADSVAAQSTGDEKDSSEPEDEQTAVVHADACGGEPTGVSSFTRYLPTVWRERVRDWPSARRTLVAPRTKGHLREAQPQLFKLTPAHV